jgi:DNA-binding NtrC family response regulator
MTAALYAEPRIELRGQLLYRLYSDLHHRLTEELVGRRFSDLSRDVQSTLFSKAIERFRNLPVPNDFIQRRSGVDPAFLRFFDNLGCGDARAIERAFCSRAAELREQIESLCGEMSAGGVDKSSPNLARLFWPLLFVRPEGKAVYTWPPSAGLIDRLRKNKGLNRTYLPTVFSREPAGAAMMAFRMAHEPGRAGHFQEDDFEELTAGVLAFDDRVIADYECTSGSWEGASFDWFMGAVSGVHVRLPLDDRHPSEARALLVLCSPIRSFFHRLVWPDAESDGEGEIVICKQEARSRDTVAVSRRWDGEKHVNVRIVSGREEPPFQFLETLRKLAAQSAADVAGELLAAVTAEGLQADGPPNSSVPTQGASPDEKGPPLRSWDQLDEILGESSAIRQIRAAIVRVAAQDKTRVLICGERGVGKDLVARAIHFGSPRKAKPFVAVNCARLGDNNADLELFGSVPGAFTGAVNRPGQFEDCDGGTLFLDEIGEMPLATQAKLLRVLEDGNVTRLGTNNLKRVDVRVLAATKNLLQDVQSGKFREDLYDRLNVVRIDVPPLRERGEDIRLLAEHYFRRYSSDSGRATCGFTGSALEHILGYKWPGNVRELMNNIERAVIMCDGPAVDVNDLRLPQPLTTAVPLALQPPSLAAPEVVLHENENFRERAASDNVECWREKLAVQKAVWNQLDSTVTGSESRWREQVEAMIANRGSLGLRNLFTVDQAVACLFGEFDCKVVVQTLKRASVPHWELRISGLSPNRYFFKDLEEYAKSK